MCYLCAAIFKDFESCLFTVGELSFLLTKLHCVCVCGITTQVLSRNSPSVLSAADLATERSSGL